MVSIISLPQHHGAFSILRLTSPVHDISYSERILRPQTVHSNVGIPQKSREIDYKGCLWCPNRLAVKRKQIFIQSDNRILEGREREG